CHLVFPLEQSILWPMCAATSTYSPADFADAAWEEILPLYRELFDRELTAENVEEWLSDWSELEEALTEAAALSMIAYTIDTADAAKEAAQLRFSGDILPRMDEQGVALANRLIGLDYSRPDLETMLARFRTDSQIFRAASLPLFSELEEHSTRYQRITGSMTVSWDGEELTLPQLQPRLKSTDRAERERAYRLTCNAYSLRRDELADVFDSLFGLRIRIAENAGFPDFEKYAFQAKHRFDYTPDDCARFHAAVERVAVPAVERLLERRRTRLGVSTLRPWDIGADPDRREPLRPFTEVGQLIGKSRRVFDHVAPTLGGEFQTMIDEGLLDLGTRKGKAPGGYCETLQHRGRPFIFMNAVGVADDVSTLLHEAGHAFHAFASHAQPLIWQRHPGLEMCELASMSMELLAAPYLGSEQGGFFTPEDLARARVEHLEDVLLSLAHIASVDAFQSWIYTSGEGGDREARDQAWLRIRSRFERGIDWSGLDEERTARWYRQLHIFLYPFYYIEYGIAQLGALQVWRNSLTDQGESVRRYRSALALGATRPLPALYAAAGAKFTFDVDDIGELVALVESQIVAWDRLRGA
ncbi:MAG: M3 family oligoendopeptidase, partial [Gemmatimonadota bacterium]